MINPDLKKAYTTHMRTLIKVLNMSKGDVVELGAGPFSTPLLHWVCKDMNRKLISYEVDPEYYNYARQFRSPLHRIVQVNDWDEVDSNTHRGLVFIDHNPFDRRAPDTIKFKDSADYVVIHDTECEDDFKTIWPHFKYAYTWKGCRPWTSVVSNSKNLSDFGETKDGAVYVSPEDKSDGSNQKLLWEKLARSNSRYFIYTSLGRGITEEQFNESGAKDYQKYILDDPLIKGGETFLEIGCGIGRLLSHALKDARFSKFIGTDISAEMIQQAKKRMPNQPNLRLIETDGYKIPLENNFVDFAFSHLVFVHFKSKEMLESNFKEVFRVLKPKGLFKVLVRADKVDLRKWWGGIAFEEQVPLDIGFKIIKKEVYDNWALWLWLEKQ